MLRRRATIAAWIVICCLILNVFATEDKDEDEVTSKRRHGKVFQPFSVVRFPNSGCISTSAAKNGSCYTAEECTDLGGAATGTCASSYGVCCVFTLGCGQSSSQNCTYVDSSNVQSGSCRMKICPCSGNICQLRLDFNQFAITGPSVSTATNGYRVNGLPVQDGLAVSSATSVSECLTDTFSVTNPDGQSPPVICGLNTGQHMYVDASDACNSLDFQLGSAAGSGNRQWSIKVTQYECNYNNLAPPGCTQYYFGSSTATIQTYNFDGGAHLADQDQNICIRQERGTCKVCYSIAMSSDFQVSGDAPGGFSVGPTDCCRYGNSGYNHNDGGDCLTVAGVVTLSFGAAAKAAGSPTSHFLSPTQRLCGSSGPITLEGQSVSICTTTAPYNVRFLSDGYETDDEVDNTGHQKGFKLTYTQVSTCGLPATQYLP